MCSLRNKAMCDYQESMTSRQTDTHTDGGTDGQTDAGQSDPHVPLCFAGDTKKTHTNKQIHKTSKTILTINIYWCSIKF